MWCFGIISLGMVRFLESRMTSGLDNLPLLEPPARSSSTGDSQGWHRLLLDVVDRFSRRILFLYPLYCCPCSPILSTGDDGVGPFVRIGYSFRRLLRSFTRCSRFVLPPFIRCTTNVTTNPFCKPLIPLSLHTFPYLYVHAFQLVGPLYPILFSVHLPLIPFV